MTDQNSFPDPTPSQQPGQPVAPGTLQPGASQVAGKLLPGVILVLLGVIFLFTNFTGYELHNWWALFILIPAFGAFANAYDRYQHAGRIDRHTRSALFGGLFFTGLAGIFLFDLSFNLLAPIGLILVGGWLLLEAFWK